MRTFQKKAEGYKVVSGGCGTYVLTRSSYMAITQIDSDGNIIRKYPKDFIREHYGVSRVSAKHLYQLKKDITNGIIKFDDIY